MREEERTAASQEDSPLLAPRAAADFLGISPARLHRLRRRGEIPALRVGWRGWRFRQSDLMAHVEKAAGVPVVHRTPVPGIFIDPTGMPVLYPAQTRDDEDKSEDDIVRCATPGFRLIDAIFGNAIDAGASDIHIEPYKMHLRIRRRVDGVLDELMMIPAHIKPPLMNRIKIMSNLDPINRQSPQISSIPLTHNKRDYTARISITPSHGGETIVLHLLDSETPQQGWEWLGVPSPVAATLEMLGQGTSGLLLFAGPPGSGLTTTAMTLLHRAGSDEKKIVTIEATVEYIQQGVTQCYSQVRRGVTTTDLVQSALRHSPDLLFLGDLRDPIDVHAAVDTALSGVLTLATIPAADSVEALRRLGDYGITGEQIARSVVGVVAQRLARRLCTECQGEGCETCRNQGCRGRVGIYELLTMTPELAAALQQGAALRETARAQGTIFLPEAGERLVHAGVTDAEEIKRALGRLPIV